MITSKQIFVMIAGLVAGTFGDLFTDFFTAFQANELFGAAGNGIPFALAFGAVAYANIPAEVLSNIRGWHGNINQQFNNISNVADTLAANQKAWNVPEDLSTQLTNDRDQLAALIIKCRSNSGSPADRAVRNTLLKALVAQCLTQIKSWAFVQHYNGVLTADDVHLLGFLLPGDAAGHHDRKEAVDELAEVKVSVINMDNIRVVIDQSSAENAALVRHGWPQGVHQAVIVIMAADGVTEVHRQMTTRLHTDIQMPAGSHGKQFILKAAFLRHVDDTPKFGNEPTFSMPLTTEDLAAAIDHQQHEDFETQLREIERHRQELEHLLSAAAAANNNNTAAGGGA
jgi:hypothetical protein